MVAAPKITLTVAEYLALETTAETKSEFINGEAVAMAGATGVHNLVKANVEFALRSRLQGGQCVPLSSDQRVLIEETGLYCYPDVVVVCGPAQYSALDGLSLLNPTLLVEVLSTSTESYDRGVKATHYRHHAGLNEFLLVDPATRTVEVFRRDGRRWTLENLGEGDALLLATLEIRLNIQEIFASLEQF